MNRMQSCVHPEGYFLYGLHRPSYRVRNQRPLLALSQLGRNQDDEPLVNAQNFPEGEVQVDAGDQVYEITNPLPFRGTTYLGKPWSDKAAADLSRIRLAEKEEVSFESWAKQENLPSGIIKRLPRSLKLSLATCSTEASDLIQLAHSCCELLMAGDQPAGLRYFTAADQPPRPIIYDHDLFEAVANNPCLPTDYQVAMVIRPGAQGGSEIVGEYRKEGTHVYEYLRRNSYIAGGHYAANMAEDAVRYSIDSLSDDDMGGLRHLYYQRTFLRLGELLRLSLPPNGRQLTRDELEELRLAILAKRHLLPNLATLWGWNFGFDFAPSGYRLHASHQQIHQQYALIDDTITAFQKGTREAEGTLAAYACGDLVADHIHNYQQRWGKSFFASYRQAIASNRRMDDRDDLESSLIIWQDERAMLFVPKAQTSQWEIQLMTLPGVSQLPAGNVLECDQASRDSLDTGLLLAQQALACLGARMVTSIELSKRLQAPATLDQPLLYSLMPKLPQSPGAFSETQLRFINGHYPEDFARACRQALATADKA